MKPNNIFLIRHGQSEGNVDKSIYSTIPDYAVQLTERGKEQAAHAGQELRRMAKGRFFFYISSYRRTRATFEGIAKSFNKEDVIFREDPRLTEQSWTGSLPKDGFKHEEERLRDAYGHFYYRFVGGESNLEVYTRISSFLETLFRDFEKPDYPENVAIVMHGMSMRVFLMRWFHMTVEEFEEIHNPANCEIVQLQLEGAKYKLLTEMRKYPRSTHPYQFPLNVEYANS